MSNHHSLTHIIIIMSGLMLFLLAACGDDKPDSTVAGSSRSNTSDSSQSVSSDTADQASSSDAVFDPTVAAILQELPGALVYYQGDNLILLPFGENVEPIVLAEDVMRDSIANSPNADTIVYQSNTNLFAFRINDLAPVNLGELIFRGGGNVESWSPDGEWFIWRVGGTTLYKVDGTASYDLAALRLGDTYGWTTSNQLIIIGSNGRQGDNFAYTEINELDLSTGEPIPIDIDLEPINSGQTSVEAALTTAGYDLLPPSWLVDYSRIQTPMELLQAPSVICSTWTIVDGNQIEGGNVIYQAPNTYMLTELTALSDDELLFVKWSTPDCDAGLPTAELVRYQTSSRQEEILAEDVFPDYRPDRISVGFTSGSNNGSHRYAVSPDSQFIMWIGGGVDANTTSLNLIDLQTGANTVILEIASGGNPSSFVANQLLAEVYWLNP